MYRQFKQDIATGRIKDPNDGYYKYVRENPTGRDPLTLSASSTTSAGDQTHLPTQSPLPGIRSSPAAQQEPSTAMGFTSSKLKTSNNAPCQDGNAPTQKATLATQSDSGSVTVTPSNPPQPLVTAPALSPGTVTTLANATPQAAVGASAPAKELTPEEQAAALQRKQKALKELDDLKAMADEVEAMIKAAMKSPAKIPENSEIMISARAATGDIDAKYPSGAKIVRIFTSSTFTDTKHERNMLMAHGYPRIKEHCRKIGYEFQVVDMRWGVRDEATDDHMGTELCLKELKLCQELSTGPNFVSLLSHKYGYTAFPRVINAEEFEKMIPNVDDQKTKDLFYKWYRKDENMIPTAYILSSISTHIPDFVSKDKEKQKVAKNQWWEENGAMQDALEATAKRVFDEETARKYIMSVTETEVQEGLLKVDNPSAHSLWLRREIEDIEQQDSNYGLSRYMECLGSNEKVQRSRQLLKQLKEDKMQKKLDPKKILNYFVKWNSDGGINPDGDEKHKDYLESMCKDFIKYMTDMIDKSVVARKLLVDDPEIVEAMQHIRFCQNKCQGVIGREDTLEQIKAYMTDITRRVPLILHGASGTGKTSIMAMAAKMAPTWFGRKPVTILRFLGTSPDSSNLMALLFSMCAQIRRAYGLPARPAMETLRLQMLDFKLMLNKARPASPLVVILDSLDQLDTMYDARQMAWLPTLLPNHVKLIVSTLPEPVYQCFPALKNLVKDEKQYIDVPVLGGDTAKLIIDNWLTSRSRKLTSHQMNVVLDAYTRCQTPLFLKLSFEEAMLWTSFTPEDSTVLQATVRACIDHLFERLEKSHGKMLVSRALGYLSLSRGGASEAELEDLLSCDDDVLNDVYMYWTPPIRRLPPLLLVRIRTDIDQYLVERGTDGLRVIYWYHRQFVEAAEARYCSDPVLTSTLHGYLGDFYNGTWANGVEKPYKDGKGVDHKADRLVSAQPLRFGGKSFNLRTLNSLPYHRREGRQLDLLKDQCLANVEFAIMKISALSEVALIDDYQKAVDIAPDDKLLIAILEALLLSRKGLKADPGQFVPQMIGRLTEGNVTREFLNKLRNYPRVYIEPNVPLVIKPGGQLLHSINAHDTDIDMMDMTRDGKYAVTVCQSEKISHIWELASAKKKRSVNTGLQAMSALFCYGDKYILYVTDSRVGVEEVESGKKVCEMPLSKKQCMYTAVGTAGSRKELVVVCSTTLCHIYSLDKDGQLLQTIVPEDKTITFDSMSRPTGSENYVAVLLKDQYYISVLYLKTMTFMPKFRGFEKVLMEDGDYDEHEVEDVAIFPDESHLAYTTMFTNEIVFADFHGNRLRSIPPNEDLTINSLNFTLDGKFLYCHSNSDFLAYDNSTLELVETLEHNKNLSGVMTLDMKRVVSIADDSTLKIWDLTREKQQLKPDISHGSLEPIVALSESFPLDHGAYEFVTGKDKAKEIYYIGVYDVCQQKYAKLREFKWTENCSRSLKKTKRADQVLVHINRKLFILDLDTMELGEPFQGIISRECKDILVTKQNEVVCVARNNINLKVYNMETGKLVSVLKGNHTQVVFSLTMNDLETIIATTTDEGPIVLYDFVKRQHLYNILDKQKYGDFFAMHLLFNTDGSTLFFNTEMSESILGKNIDDVDHMVAWDVAGKCEMFRMIDVKDAQMHARNKSDESVSVDSVHKLNDDRLLIVGLDNVIRVHDMKTGELLHRLGCHSTSVEVHLSATSPYFVTYGCLPEEDCLVLWDKNTLKKIASYSIDFTLNKIAWNHEGTFFHALTRSNAMVVKWKIHHGDPHVQPYDTVQTEPIFSPQVTFEKKVLTPPSEVKRDYVPESDDPDTDIEVWSDSDDDDDDDDE